MGSYEPKTRIFGYREGREENGESAPWGHTDYSFHTASLCAFKDPKNSGQQYFVALSSEGDVYHHGLTESFMERITGAGVDHEDSLFYGRMTSVQQIGDKLYACGDGGQIYVRHGRDDWRFLTRDLLYDPEKAQEAEETRPEDANDIEANRKWMDALEKEQERNNPEHYLHDINGSSESEIYICSEEGSLFLWDGEELEDIETDADGPLVTIHAAKDKKVWVCGRKGQLFSIDPENGLEDHSVEESDNFFSSVTEFGGRILLASQAKPVGLFEFDSNSEELVPVSIDITPPLKTIKTVKAVDGALWVVGNRDMLRLKNDIWERIKHPDITTPG